MCTGVAWGRMEGNGTSATRVMHDARRAQGGPAANGLKGDSGHGGVRLYQVLSKVHGKACEGRMKCAQWVHGGAWRQIQ